MLGKLFRHEMKATSRLLLPVYLVLVVFMIMDKIVLSLDIFHGVFGMIPFLITTMYILSVAAIIIVSFVIIVLRFYKNLVTDEGYLMFTLPVKPHQLINSKLIVATIWTIASILVSILSIIVVVSSRVSLHDIGYGFSTIMKELDVQMGSYSILFIIEMILTMFFSIINNILLVYVSIALGQLFSGHKIIGSFVSYIGITTVLQIISTVFMIAAGLLFEDYFTNVNSLPQLIFPFTLVLVIVLNVIYYAVTELIFKRKLNLE